MYCHTHDETYPDDARQCPVCEDACTQADLKPAYPLATSLHASLILGKTIELRRMLKRHFEMGETPIPAEKLEALFEAADGFVTALEEIEI